MLLDVIHPEVFQRPHQPIDHFGSVLHVQPFDSHRRQKSRVVEVMKT